MTRYFCSWVVNSCRLLLLPLDVMIVNTSRLPDVVVGLRAFTPSPRLVQTGNCFGHFVQVAGGYSID